MPSLSSGNRPAGRFIPLLQRQRWLIYNSVRIRAVFCFLPPPSAIASPSEHREIKWCRIITFIIILQQTAPGTGSSSITTGGNANSSADRIKKKPLPKKRTKLQQQQQQLTKDATTPVIPASSATSPGKLLLGKKKAPPTISGSPRKVKQKRIEATDEKAAGDESQSELLTGGEVSKKKASEVSEAEAAVKDTGLSRKRMASLNASAFMAATYEAEQTLDRNLSATESSSEDGDDDDKSQNTDTDAKSQQSSVPSSTGGSKAKSSTAGSVRSSAIGKRAPKKVKKEAVDESKNVSEDG